MRKNPNKCQWLLAAAGLVTVGAQWSQAGPLTPPSGPVASTYKTLTEVEPRVVVNATNTPGDSNSVYRIASPGSYYLDQNLACVSGKHGIKIDADNVTLDLKGFAILGVTGSSDGINVPSGSGHVTITIRNGTIRGCPGSGIFAGGVANSVYTDLFITNNALDGLWTGDKAAIERVISISNRNGIITGGGCRVAFSACESNSQNGFNCSADTILTSCTTRGNALSGFRASDGCAAFNCVATVNTGHGFEFTGIRNDAQECGSYFNGGNGFLATNFTRLTACHADNNAQNGIHVGDYCSLRSCDAVQNTAIGVSATLSAEVADCSASLNGGAGITVTGGGNVQRCVVTSNTGAGVIATSGCTIAHCTSQSNSADGISVTSSCYVLDNTCDLNGTASGSQGGVRIGGTGNRIEGNSLTGNDYSIWTPSPGDIRNIIVRNTSTSPVTGHFQVAPGNSLGPVVTVTGVNDISTVANSSHPMANFIY